jgi:hypothetical protein
MHVKTNAIIAIILLLNGCVTSQHDREHHCATVCEGKCTTNCDIVIEQGGTEVHLPGQ